MYKYRYLISFIVCLIFFLFLSVLTADSPDIRTNSKYKKITLPDSITTKNPKSYTLWYDGVGVVMEHEIIIPKPK